jgi:hypothetical protein
MRELRAALTPLPEITDPYARAVMILPEDVHFGQPTTG